MIHITISPIKKCKNTENIYKYSCYRCNKCGRFNQKCFICKKVIKPDDENILYVEFWDVFAAPFCKSHEPLIKKHGKWMPEYNKYDCNMRINEFLKLVK